MADTMFEPNGLLDFPSTPPLDDPPITSLRDNASMSHTGTHTGPSSTSEILDTPLDFEADEDIFAALSTTNAPTKAIAREQDGPDEWEDEMLAMQEMEEEEELARATAALAAAPTPGRDKGKGKVTAAEDDIGGFGESDMFEDMADFERMQAEREKDEPGPSRRTRLSSMEVDGDLDVDMDQPVPGQADNRDVLPRMRLPHVRAIERDEPRCLLPALRAETASGRMLYIKRRYRPKPRVLPVSLLVSLSGSHVQAAEWIQLVRDPSRDEKRQPVYICAGSRADAKQQEAPNNGTGPNLLSQPLAALLRDVQSLRDAQQAREYVYLSARVVSYIRWTTRSRHDTAKGIKPGPKASV